LKFEVLDLAIERREIGSEGAPRSVLIEKSVCPRGEVHMYMYHHLYCITGHGVELAGLGWVAGME
jgi:hypothetical protein